MFRPLLALALAAIAAPAQAQSMAEVAKVPQGVRVSAATEQFVRAAAIGDMYQIESGRLVIERSDQAEFREFARRTIDEHTRASEELGAIAQRNDLRLPDHVDHEHRNRLGELQHASDLEFEQLYRNQQLEVYGSAIRLFENYANKGEHQELRTYAAKALPALKKHLRLAHALPPPTGAPAIAAIGGARAQAQAQQQDERSGTLPIVPGPERIEQRTEPERISPGEAAQRSRQQGATISPAPQRAPSEAIAAPAPGQMLASDLRGMTVYAANDENVGQVNDVLITRDGRVAGLLVGVGGFLGIGEKNVAIPIEAIEIVDARQSGGAPGGDQGDAGGGPRVILQGMTREDLDAAPGFRAGEGSRE